MTSPRALCLSLAATVCGFALALVLIASQASTAATPVVSATTGSSTVAVVAQEIGHAEPALVMVAWESASRSQARGR
jgi:hypothetical protein